MKHGATIDANQTVSGGDNYGAFGMNDEAITEAVVNALSEATGKDPLSLPPLYEAIDPDALNALFENSFEGTSAQNISVSFTVADHRVVVHDDGTVHVTAES